jgi:long-chain acyl-CoA synthetase
VISDAFTIENGLLTPTMKVKRNKVKEIYGKQLESLYK